MAPSIIPGNTHITTSRNRSGTAANTVINAVALGLLAASLAFAGRSLAVEYDVMQTKAASLRQAGELAGFQAVLDSPVPSVELPPRSALFRGIMRSRAAAETPADAGRLLRMATADLDHARHSRRSWGEAEVGTIYLALLRDGAQAPDTLDALRRSYAAAPFLRDSAPWRIRYAVSVWPLLDPTTRSRVVDETVWLARATDHTYTYARGLVSGSPAAPLVDAALAASRDD